MYTRFSKVMCVEIRLKTCLRANPITDLMSKLNQFLRTIRLSGQVTETLEAVVFGFVWGAGAGFLFLLLVISISHNSVTIIHDC